MQISAGRPLQLTYCTNIHAADGWPAVRANLARYAVPLKGRFAPDAPFGIGLRLSAREARELLAGGLDELRAFLDREGLYIALINGFPQGTFHGAAVKADVYAPDWRDPARLQYTLDLAAILKALVPPGLDGGISTAPLSYKAWMSSAGPRDWMAIVDHLVAVAQALVRIRRDEGALIHLDIEPEPDCAIENAAEMIDFFERWLLPHGAPRLAVALGSTLDAARESLLEHVRVCFDCCHFAVEFEDPLAALRRLEQAGLRIGRVQLSSALRVVVPPETDEAARVAGRLRPFADSTYLHQVIARRDDTLVHFADLDEALASPQAGEWRIHFHVPLFTGDLDGLASTQEDVRAVLAAVRDRPCTTHLEIETYTWDVLPPELKVDLLDSIGREYAWVLETFRRQGGSAA